MSDEIEVDRDKWVVFPCQHPAVRKQVADGTPRSAHQQCRVPLAPVKNHSGATWQLVDGTPGKITISPSINCQGCWHGFIRDGKIVDA